MSTTACCKASFQRAETQEDCVGATVYVCVCVGMDECAKNGRNKERKMKRDVLKE